LEAIVKDHTLKAYLHFYLDAEDSFEYRTWNSNWECMLYDGAYMTDGELL